MQNATVVIKKLKKMLGIKTDLELSRILDVKPNTISSWKKRNSLQYDSLIALCKEHKIDLNELFFADSSDLYLFVLEGRGMLIYRYKRVTDTGKLLFISDNPNYENLEVNPTDIREIFCIRGAFLPNFKGIGDI